VENAWISSALYPSFFAEAAEIPEGSTKIPTYPHALGPAPACRPEGCGLFPHSHRLYYYYDDMYIIPRPRNVFGETWIQGDLESI